MVDFEINYKELEQGFNVLHPNNENATYLSQVNYSDDLNTPFQRWYRYKEGFSIELVKRLIREQTQKETGLIVDPFSGSGSALIAANQIGFKGVGFEVNPFSYFLSKVKLENYSNKDLSLFKELFNKILVEDFGEYSLPLLSFAERVFNEAVKGRLMTIKNNIVRYESEGINPKIINLLKLGWLSAIEDLSNYRKAGNGLKIRRLKNPIILTDEDVISKMNTIYKNMYMDLKKFSFKSNVDIFNKTCLKMDDYIKEKSVTGIIFSPPYANCFDYTEIYKLELWFGDFVSEYSDLKDLRKSSLRSHLNANLKEDLSKLNTLPELTEIIDEIESKDLWDKRIPTMLRLYFHDMFKVIEKCYKLLEDKGFCNIIVSNSAYGGVVVPTDLLFALFAENIGFKVSKIEVARYIITSSQQYNVTKDQRKYLRESVICLKKN